jgi:hypothetical protein
MLVQAQSEDGHDQDAAGAATTTGHDVSDRHPAIVRPLVLWLGWSECVLWATM